MKLSKISNVLFALFALVGLSNAQLLSTESNQCVRFSVAQGTGCAWMCNYCANQLGTNNYYFTDNVCTYQQGEGCVGNPIAGQTYTCCSAGDVTKKGKKDKKKKENNVCKREYSM